MPRLVGALHRAAEGVGDSKEVERLVYRGATINWYDRHKKTALFKAVRSGNVEAAKTLVRFGAKTDTVTWKGENLLDAAMNTWREAELHAIHFVLSLNLDISADQYGKLLFQSADRGYLEIIKSLIELKSVNINYENWRGSALHRAVEKENSEIMEYLVLKGANIEAKDSDGQTPMFAAVKRGKIEAAKTLLKLGAKVDIVDKKGVNLLAAAMKDHKVESIHFVLGLDLRISTDQYGELLFESVDKDNLETIKLLVCEHKDMDVNHVNKTSQTALHRAAEKGNSEIVEYLVLNGANVEAVDKIGRTPLFIAVNRHKISTAKTLIRLGAKTDTVDEDEKNLLDAAMDDYEIELIHFVLGLDLDIAADQYGKLLWRSAYEGDLEAIKLLVEFKDVNINYIHECGQSALHCAAKKGNSEIVEYLVLKGADLEVLDNNGRTPLFLAVDCSRIESAETLIRHGAKVDIVDEKGKNLLERAVVHVELIRLILEHSYDIDQYDKTGYTLLMQACRLRIEKSAAFLLEKGADYRKYSIPNGLSPLHLAVNGTMFSSVSFIKLLIEHVEIIEGETGMLDYVDYNGDVDSQTALHLACILRDNRATKLLLHCGANPNIRDKFGKVPDNYDDDDDYGFDYGDYDDRDDDYHEYHHDPHYYDDHCHDYYDGPYEYDSNFYD